MIFWKENSKNKKVILLGRISSWSLVWINIYLKDIYLHKYLSDIMKFMLIGGHSTVYHFYEYLFGIHFG